MNTCIELASQYRTIVIYSHFIPVAIATLLALFVLIKSKFTLLANLFALFVVGFCYWLIGDVVLWGTVPNYHIVTAVWASMDYLNIVFYLLACYFFAVLIKGQDILNWQKILLLVLSLPAWFVTIQGHAVTDFYQPFCEASNNTWLTEYKLIVEVLVLAFIMFSAMRSVISKDKTRMKQIITVGIALVLFLAIFASTEYISSVTGIYEINLYSLFVLPVFLVMIIFSITNLKIFAFKSYGTQLLIYVLLILVGSQFFFLQDATYRILTLVTFIISVFLGTVLVKNISREEQLAIALAEANEGQADLLHIINHQIKGYMTKARLVLNALMTDRDYGPISDQAMPLIKEGFDSVTEGVNFVQDFLNASNIDKGTFSYNMETVDLKSVVESVAVGQKDAAEAKGLSFDLQIADGNYQLNGDKIQLTQAVRNLFDNAIKYTPKGSMSAKLERVGDKIRFSVKDTGVGITDELKPKLFTKGGRDKDSQKINVNSTGFGLSFVRGVAEAHKGRVWAESPGHNQGSTFNLELPVVKN